MNSEFIGDRIVKSNNGVFYICDIAEPSSKEEDIKDPGRKGDVNFLLTKSAISEGLDKKLINKLYNFTVSAYRKRIGYKKQTYENNAESYFKIFDLSLSVINAGFRISLLEVKGWKDFAIEAYEKTLDNREFSKIANLRLAEIHHKQGDYKKSEEYMDEVFFGLKLIHV